MNVKLIIFASLTCVGLLLLSLGVIDGEALKSLFAWLAGLLLPSSSSEEATPEGPADGNPLPSSQPLYESSTTPSSKPDSQISPSLAPIPW